jgi:hypothetical protein
MDKQKEDLTNVIRDNKMAMEAADKDLSNRITQLNETVMSNLNKGNADNLNIAKQLENVDSNLKNMVKDANDRNAKLREYCNETFTIISI